MTSLTIIIPTYNRPQETLRAIESIVHDNSEQACKIIVVDDCSDLKFELPEKFDRFKIKVIRHEQNRGASAARNTGISNATTPLISFLDSDDQLLPDTLAKRMEFALSHKLHQSQNRNMVVGCGWSEYVGETETRASRIPLSSSRPDDFFGGCWFCPGSCVIFNAEIFIAKDMQFDESLRRLEDSEWFMRFALQGGRYVNQPIIGCKIIINESKDYGDILNAYKTLHHKYLDSKNTSLSPTQSNRLKAYLYLELANALRRKGATFTAIEYAIASMVSVPRLSIHLTPGWQK